jgi:AhpC/TSA family
MVINPYLSFRETQSARMVVALLVFSASVVAGGCGRSPDTPTSAATEFVPTKPAATARQPLAPGDALPPIAAEGWLNGPPPGPSSPGVRLLVIDVRAEWCPYCRQSSPDLVAAFSRHSPRGVAFVSLTNMPRGAAETFVREYSVPWAIGYRTSAETLTALGVASNMGVPGYEVAPTLYVVGPDGRVRWTDGQGRFRHTDPKVWARQLDQAINAALGPRPPLPVTPVS